MKGMKQKGSRRYFRKLCIALFVIFTLALCAKSTLATHKDSVITPLGNNKFQMTFQDCMFVEQDGKWVAPEKARSLKDSGCFKWVVIQEGTEKYDVEVVDYNLTSITIKYNSLTAIPVTIYSKDETKTALSYSTPKEAIDKGAYTAKTAKTSMNLKNGVTLPIKMGDIIKIGDNSSYLQSQPAGVTGIETDIASTHPDSNLGVLDTMYLGEIGETFRVLFKINWTGMGLYTANISSIDSINLSVYVSEFGGNPNTVTMYPMLTCWDEGTGTFWTAGDPSWNYNDSASNRNWLGGAANTDYNSSLGVSRVFSGIGRANYSINSSIANGQFKKTVPDCGFIFISDKEGVANNYVMFRSSDDATAANRPIYYITFTGLGGGLTWENIYNNASNVTWAGLDVNWTANISDNFALSYAILATNDTGTWTNLTPVLIGGTNYNFSYTKTIVASANKYVCGKVWFNDSLNADNTTDESCFTVGALPDSTHPTWNDLYNNASTITIAGRVVNWTVNLSDETNLNAAILTTNDTGAWVNESTITISGKSYNFSYGKTITASVGEYVCGRIWFQDANNNANETDNSCFTIITSLNLKLKDIYDSSYIPNFTATLNNSQTATTSEGNISFVLEEGTYKLNFTNIGNNTYFNASYTLIVSGDRYNFTGSTYQSILSITAFTKITNTQISQFNVSANQTHENVTINGYVQLYVRAGTYRLRANSSNSSKFPYTIYNDSITVSALQNKSVILYFHNVELNVSAKNFFGDDVIANFSINISYPTYNYFEEKSTTTGTIWFNVTQGTYNLVIWNNTEQIDNATISVTKTPYNHTFYLLKAGNLYLRVWDEETLLPTNASIDLIGSSQTGNYSTSNGTLLFSGLAFGDYELRYTNTGYRPRQYFFTLSGEGAEVIDLYLLNSTAGSLILFTIYDESGLELEGTTLKLLRYYPSKAGYVTVAMTKSDFSGYALLDAVLYDTFYQVIVDYEGRTLFTSGETKMASITRSIFVDTTTDFFQTFSQIRNFYYILNYDNGTGMFSFTYSSTANLVSEVCLNVVKIGAKWTDICNNCQTSVAGTITCNITSYGFDGAYNAQGKVKSGDMWYVVGELSKDFIEPLAFSTNMPMLFLAFIFIAGITTISLANPIIAMILSVFGTIALVSTKFFTLTEMGIIGLVITLMIIVLAMYRRMS